MATAVQLKVTLTIPQRSHGSTLAPAIGLAAAVHKEDSVNPFDLGEALARQAVPQPILTSVPAGADLPSAENALTANSTDSAPAVEQESEASR